MQILCGFGLPYPTFRLPIALQVNGFSFAISLRFAVCPNLIGSLKMATPTLPYFQAETFALPQQQPET
nr:hypothetical protein [uncultured Kingella sp.]